MKGIIFLIVVVVFILMWFFVSNKHSHTIFTSITQTNTVNLINIVTLIRVNDITNFVKVIVNEQNNNENITVLLPGWSPKFRSIITTTDGKKYSAPQGFIHGFGGTIDVYTVPDYDDHYIYNVESITNADPNEPTQ